jgi:hypothetical protein
LIVSLVCGGPSFFVLLYLAGGGFWFLATQNHVFQVD